MISAATGRSSALESRIVFASRVVAGITNVSVPIACLVTMEVSKCVVATVRKRTMITMAWVEAVIDVAIETARAMEPGAGTDEHPIHEPVRTVVAVGGAIIRGVVKVSIGAVGRRSKVYAYGYLSLGGGSKTHQHKGESRESKQLPI
jgi:hypothetical protein